MQFKASAGTRYKNPVTGQEVSYTQEQLDTPGGAIGFLSDQYKPVTAGAAPTAPTTPTSPTSPTSSTGANGGQPGGTGGATGGTDQAINRPVLDFGQTGDNYYQEPKKVDYEAIRKQEMDKAQAMIDATQGLYDQSMLDIRRRGQANLQQSQSIGVGAGLAGSPFAAAQDKPVVDATDREAKAETARRQAEIAMLMGKGDEKAIARYKDERDQASSDRDKYVNEQKANKEEFRSIIANAAAQGIKYSEFTPEQKAQAKQRSGLDDFGLEVYFNANKPKAEQKDITYQTVGNKVIGYYTEFDANGKPMIKSFESEPLFDLPETSVDYNVQMAPDGTMLLIPKTFDPNKPVKDQIVEYGNYAKPEEAKADPMDELLSTSDLEKFVLPDGSKLPYGTTRREAIEAGAVVGAGSVDPKVSSDLRKEFEGRSEVKNWRDIDRSYNAMVAANELAAQGDNAPARDALIILFNKMLDPGSVVREGEFARTAEGQSMLQQGYEMLKRLNQAGAGVDPAILKQALDVAESLHTSGQDAYNGVVDQYTGLANSYGVEPGLVVGTTSVGSGGEQQSFENLTPIKQSYATLPALISTQPEYQAVVDALRKENPDASPQDILEIITETYSDFKGDLSTSKNGSNLGALSASYESKGDPGIVGYDAVGGKSYGTYQLIPSNANQFVKNSAFAGEFKGLSAGTPAFEKRWKEVARAYPTEFAKAQEHFIKQSHYDPQIQLLSSKGYDVTKRSDAVKQVVWSTAVQHGAKTDVVARAFKKVGKNATDEQLINAIYDERWSGGKRFASSNQQVKNSVYNRFFGKNGEKAQALALVKNSRTA